MTRLALIAIALFACSGSTGSERAKPAAKSAVEDPPPIRDAHGEPVPAWAQRLGDARWTFPTAIDVMAAAPHAPHVALIGGSKITIVDAAKRSIVKTLTAPCARLSSVAWSTDGTRLATGCGHTFDNDTHKGILVWALAAGTHVHVPVSEEEVEALAPHGPDSFIAGDRNGRVHVVRDRVLKTIEAFESDRTVGTFESIVPGPRPDTVLATGTKGTFVIDLAAMSSEKQKDVYDAVVTGDRMVVARFEYLQLERGEDVLVSERVDVSGLVASTDGSIVFASAKNEIRAYRVEPKMLVAFGVPRPGNGLVAITHDKQHVLLTDDSQLVLSFGTPGDLRDARTDHQSAIMAMAVSPDGVRIATFDTHGNVLVRAIADGAIVARASAGALTHGLTVDMPYVAWRGDARVEAGFDSAGLTLDVATNTTTPRDPAWDRIIVVAFDRAGTRAATIREHDSEVVFWDTSGAAPRELWRERSDPNVYSMRPAHVSVSDDGTRVAVVHSAIKRSEVRVRDDKGVIATIVVPEERVQTGAMSRDGKRVAVPVRKGLRVVDVATLQDTFFVATPPRDPPDDNPFGDFMLRPEALAIDATGERVTFYFRNQLHLGTAKGRVSVDPLIGGAAAAFLPDGRLVTTEITSLLVWSFPPGSK